MENSFKKISIQNGSMGIEIKQGEGEGQEHIDTKITDHEEITMEVAEFRATIIRVSFTSLEATRGRISCLN